MPPGDSRELASAIERVIQEGVLRRKLIKEGYELARASTFEHLGKQFLDDVSGVAATDSDS